MGSRTKKVVGGQTFILQLTSNGKYMKWKTMAKLLRNPFIRIKKLFVLILCKAVCHSCDIVTNSLIQTCFFYPLLILSGELFGIVDKGYKKFFQEPLRLIRHPGHPVVLIHVFKEEKAKR